MFIKNPVKIIFDKEKLHEYEYLISLQEKETPCRKYNVGTKNYIRFLFSGQNPDSSERILS